MIRARPIRAGFTLIELIAVIVVLAILAGVALPKYFDYAAQARASSCKGTLGGVRSGIANFYMNTGLSGPERYPTYAEVNTLGTVMQEPIPANPYNNSAAIRNADATWVAGNPPTSGAQGWAYDQTNGKFWANSNTVGENAF
jgi:prepilin-type N-terminal cleavage/methylation domain-containing protein